MSTAKASAQQLRCYAYPVWEKRALRAIKPGDVQSWITSLTTTHKLAASTSRSIFNTVNAVFRAAVRDRMIPHNPCTDAKLPSVPRKKVVPLAVEQVRTLAQEIPRPLQRPGPAARLHRAPPRRALRPPASARGSAARGRLGRAADPADRKARRVRLPAQGGLCADHKGRPTRSTAGQTAFRRTY
ncbi:hypothetical protein [Streptomyces sp. NBC_01341]|uniref:hypothetical protein n=1 Tax=Streptomyces sp. NBC_01341 TaxID=2903831 RepID=UPI003FA3A30F